MRKMNGGNSDLFRLAYAPGAKPQSVALPYVGDIDGLATDLRVPGVVFKLGGWTRFGGYYAYDSGSRGKVADTGLQPQGKYDNPANLVATEAQGKSHDGTMVPMSIVHRKGIKLDGTNPTIVLMDTVLTASRRRRSSGRRGCRGSIAAAYSRSRTSVAAASTARNGTRPATRRPSPTRGATPSPAPNGLSRTSTRRPRRCRSWVAAPAASSSVARSPNGPISSVRRSIWCPCPIRCVRNSPPTAFPTSPNSAP